MASNFVRCQNISSVASEQENRDQTPKQTISASGEANPRKEPEDIGSGMVSTRGRSLGSGRHFLCTQSTALTTCEKKLLRIFPACSLADFTQMVGSMIVVINILLLC